MDKGTTSHTRQTFSLIRHPFHNKIKPLSSWGSGNRPIALCTSKNANKIFQILSPTFIFPGSCKSSTYLQANSPSLSYQESQSHVSFIKFQNSISLHIPTEKSHNQWRPSFPGTTPMENHGSFYLDERLREHHFEYLSMSLHHFLFLFLLL